MTEQENKAYKWRLTWSGQKSTPCLQATVKHIATFPLVRDSEAHLINHEEFRALVDSGEIHKPESYWQISPGEVGLISLSSYSSYTNTWDQISTCKGDFNAGWCLAMKERRKS
jgi:hypothetical protein